MLNTNEMNTIALSLMPAMRGMFAKLYNGRDADIDDAVQDGFLFLITYALPRYDETLSEVAPFALGVLKRRFYNFKKSHAQSRTGSFAVDEDGNGGPDTLAGSSDVLARAIEAELLTLALNVLNGQERALCEAYMASGEWAQAAEAIGVSRVKASRMKADIQAKVADVG